MSKIVHSPHLGTVTVTDLHQQAASMFFCWPANVIDLCKEDKDLPKAIEKLAEFIARWEKKGHIQGGIHADWAPIDSAPGSTPVHVSKYGWLPMTACRELNGNWTIPGSGEKLCYEPTHWCPLIKAIGEEQR